MSYYHPISSDFQAIVPKWILTKKKKKIKRGEEKEWKKERRGSTVNCSSINKSQLRK
jgi:hypothetical protein